MLYNNYKIRTELFSNSLKFAYAINEFIISEGLYFNFILFIGDKKYMHSINKDIYRMSTIGECLLDSLTDLQEKGIVNEDLKNYTLSQFDTVYLSTANSNSIPKFSKQP